MFSLGSSHRYYLYQGYCDMRKNMDGLSGLVSSELCRSPTSGEVFVFLNRRRTHLKLLHWEPGGFVLYYKRLESGTFPLPKNAPMDQLSWSDLILMVQGIRVVKSIQNKRYQLVI
jgi:transposase